MSNTLRKLKLDNSFVEQLPADTISENTSRLVTDACYSKVLPRIPKKPELVYYSPEVARLIDLSDSDCQSELFRNVFTGKELLSGMKPYASCYGGHQFGNWAGQLGDGRAINLGDVINNQKQRWALQLKGAGSTPYSRHADGLAVLRSSIREFLCSEAMYHLGVPTTRALSVCLTGEMVNRDMFYDGNPIDEPGAVVCRVAPSFTRFGHLQIFASRDDKPLLKRFLDHTIRVKFPHLGDPSEAVYNKWFSEVCQSTKIMVLHWMRVGFVHGVMNTDNMSVHGLTIDYGPYGWLEGYEQRWTPNTTDAQGKRYCYGQQPTIAHWNLIQLAHAIAPLLSDVESIKASLAEFAEQYSFDWQKMMREKLGLQENNVTEDEALIAELLQILQLTETDMTIFFRRLADIDPNYLLKNEQYTNKLPEQLMDAYFQPDSLSCEIISRTNQWLQQYANRSIREDSYSFSGHRNRMNRVNPKYVLRNYLAQQAIEKSEQGDHSMVKHLFDVMKHPYDEQPENEQFAVKRPEWARHKAGCSMLSCSS